MLEIADTSRRTTQGNERSITTTPARGNFHWHDVVDLPSIVNKTRRVLSKREACLRLKFIALMIHLIDC